MKSGLPDDLHLSGKGLAGRLKKVMNADNPSSKRQGMV
jgi:hypothetical protein